MSSLPSQNDSSPNDSPGLEIDDLIRIAQQNLRNEPDNVDMRAELAILYGWRGRATDAIREFRTCLQQNPNNGRALMGYGQFLFAQGNVDTAIEYLKRAGRSATDPQDQILALAVLGAAYRIDGNRHGAIVIWKALADPRHRSIVGISADFCLGIAYLEGGRVADALSQFKLVSSQTTHEDDGGYIGRFSKTALALGKDQLSSWPKFPTTREMLDIYVNLAWGIGGYVMNEQMVRRLNELTLELLTPDIPT